MRARLTFIPAPLTTIPWPHLGVLSLAAFALRLPGLNSCLWVDEVFALLDCIRPPATVILTSFPSQNQHMLYSLLAHASCSLAGESAWAIRLPAVLFGVASLWPLYLLGRRLSGHWPALVACALLTASPHHIWFSQNARGYSALLFCALASLWFWLEANDSGATSLWAAFVAVSACGLWIHMTMAFPLVVMGAFALARPRVRPLAALALTASLALHAYSLALPEFLGSALGEVSLPSQWIDPAWLAGETLRNLAGAGSSSGLSLFLVLAALLTAALGWAAILRSHPQAALLMALPPLAGGGAMILLAHNLWPRFFFFAAGFAVLCGVNGLFQIARWLRPPPFARAFPFAAAALLLAVSLAALPRIYSIPKQDFTGARDFVESRLRAGQQPAALGLAGKVFIHFAPHWSRPADDAAFVKLPRPDWLVYTIPIQMRAWHPLTWYVLNTEYDVVRVLPGTLGDGAVYVCRLKARRAPDTTGTSP